MKVGTLGSLRSKVFNPSNVRDDSNGLTKQNHNGIRELHQTWYRLALQVLSSEASPTRRVLGITSSLKGEGKTTNCLGLVTAIAQEIEEKVLLLECDLYSPSIALQLGLSPKPGLAEFITQGEPLNSENGDRDGSVRKKSPRDRIKTILQSTNLANLDVIVAGEDDNMTGEWGDWGDQALSKLRKRLPGFLDGLKQQYAYIIVDMPPILTNPYTKDMVNTLDGTFVTVRADVTAIEDLAKATQEIGDEKLSGVILIGTHARLPSWLARIVPE